MDITFVVPCKDLSGGLRMIAGYGNLLKRRGHNVTIIYPEKKLSWKRELKQTVISAFNPTKDHLDLFHGDLLAVPIIDDIYFPDGDIVIATAWQTAEWVADLSDRCGKKYYFIQGYETWTGDSEKVDATFKLPLFKFANSNWLKTIVEEKCDQTIPVIWNGRDFHMSESLGEGVNRKYDLGMIYSSVSIKRAKDGLQAINKIVKAYPGLRVVMFGSEKPDILLDNIKFYKKPTQAQIKEIYLSTKVWMSTSLMEGFCLPALEAISLGSVVVSTNSLGVQDIITDGIEGYLVEPGNTDQLVQRVLELLNDPEKMRKYQEIGLRKSEQFSWNKSGDKLEKLLHQSDREAA